MSIRVIVLNGGSSSGKTSVARRLQAILPAPWLLFGVDTLVDALPDRLRDNETGIGFSDDGQVRVDETFHRLEVAFDRGIGEMARAGAHVIVDDVFLGGAASQQRWASALAGLPVAWVGVRCDPSVAAAREAARGDRITGMAAGQAELVHTGVEYDLVVDTSRRGIDEVATAIVAGLPGLAVPGAGRSPAESSPPL